MSSKILWPDGYNVFSVLSGLNPEERKQRHKWKKLDAVTHGRISYLINMARDWRYQERNVNYGALRSLQKIEACLDDIVQTEVPVDSSEWNVYYRNFNETFGHKGNPCVEPIMILMLVLGEIHKVGDLRGYDPRYTRIVEFIFDAIGKYSKAKEAAQKRRTIH
jgi:hypothetical protein